MELNLNEIEIVEENTKKVEKLEIEINCIEIEINDEKSKENNEDFDKITQLLEKTVNELDNVKKQNFDNITAQKFIRVFWRQKNENLTNRIQELELEIYDQKQEIIDQIEKFDSIQYF